MNKKELVAATAEASGMPKKCVEMVLKALTANVIAEVAKKGKVQLIGFGTFEVKSRPARVARNPRTGEEIKIAASKAPAFKAGKALKDKVNTPAKKKGKK